MDNVLPQQKLLLELLIASGEIAVPESTEPTLLWSTLGECKAAGWIRLREISRGLHRVDITAGGRRAVRRQD